MPNQNPTLYFNTSVDSSTQNFPPNRLKIKKVNTWFDKLKVRELVRINKQNSSPYEQSSLLVQKNNEESLPGYKDDIQNNAIINQPPLQIEEIEKTIEEEGKEEQQRSQAMRIEAERQSV